MFRTYFIQRASVSEDRKEEKREKGEEEDGRKGMQRGETEYDLYVYEKG